MRPSAEAFSRGGDRYIGTPYDQMDCQAFVEAAMRTVGITDNLPGSNAWYRAMTWTGTPEACIKTFGAIPVGALLFILSRDGGEPEKYRGDGIGNAGHMGYKTGRGKGAMHSSKSMGCVCESAFADKSVSGGWNRVGLWSRMDYGKSVNWLLDHIGLGQEGKKEEAKTMQATARSDNGKSINLRKTKGGDLLDRVPSGDAVEILESGDEWSRVKWRGKTGWMKTEFLTTESGTDDAQTDERVALYFRPAEISAALPMIESFVAQAVDKVGRG